MWKGVMKMVWLGVEASYWAKKKSSGMKAESGIDGADFFQTTTWSDRVFVLKETSEEAVRILL